MKIRKIILYMAILLFVITVGFGFWVLSLSTTLAAEEHSRTDEHGKKHEQEECSKNEEKCEVEFVKNNHAINKKENKHDEHEDEKIINLSNEEIKEFGIELKTAGAGKLNIERALTGEVVFDPDKIAHIVPRVSGIVKKVLKKLGDSVKKGEVIAVLESGELAQLKGEYLAEKKRCNLAERNFEREKNLYEKKISSEKAYLDSKMQLAETKINLRMLSQKLAAIGFSKNYIEKLHTQSEALLTKYNIRAPFNGKIVKKHIVLGEKADSDENIFTIADLNKVWISLTVYQKDLAAVKKDQEVKFFSDQTGISTKGKIDYITPFIEESTRTATARIIIDNKAGSWYPGMFVTGLVALENVNVNLVVAKSSFQVVDGETVIFVKTDEGFEPRPVKIGRTDSTYSEIVLGLSPGQVYVEKNSFTLKAELGKDSLGDGHGH
jgi:cobalt-zinc-cadmium efflux system membrane fusion protein